MEFVRPPRRSPRFPHSSTSSASSPSSSSSLATHATATINGAAGSNSVLTHNHTNTNTHPHHPSNGHQSQGQDPIPTTTIPTNKKRPRLTLDLPDIPNIPAGLSPRDIRALKRRKLLHPTSAPPSPTSFLSSLPSLPVASSSTSTSPPHPSSSPPQQGSSPLTSPISAISNRSSTPPPPPSIPPLIQPTSANAVRGERRKKMAFESSPLSRSSTTPTTPTTPTTMLKTEMAMAGPSTRHSYALRSAPAQVQDEMEVDDLKGKGKEKVTESTGSKRRRKENSAVLANGPVLKRLRSNSTPASLTSLPNTTRSRRGILRPAPAPRATPTTATSSPSLIPASAKGKGKAVEFDLSLPSTSMEDEVPRLEKRSSIRSLRSNSTVTTEIALPLPSRRVRAPSSTTFPNTPTNSTSNDSSSPSSTSPTLNGKAGSPNGKARGRGRGRGGRAAVRGRGRGRKRVDVIQVEASPKVEASDGVERDGGDVEAMELAEPSREEEVVESETPVVVEETSEMRSSTPEPVAVAEAAPLVKEVEEVSTPTVVATPVVEVSTTSPLSPLSPLSSEPPTPSTLTPSAPSLSSLEEVAATPDSAAAAEGGEPAAQVTAPTPQRPPLRLRIPGEEVSELATTTTGQGWESYLGDVQQVQQQQETFSVEQQQQQQTSQMVVESTGIAIPMSLDPSSSQQQQHHEQIPYPHSTEQSTYGGEHPESSAGYDTDGFTLDQAYQEQLAQQQQAMQQSMDGQSMHQQQQQMGSQQQQMQMQQVQQVQQVQRRQTAPGLWEVACKIRVCELERRYSWITIRDLVTQEATEYAMRHGIPRSWWRVTHPPPVVQMQYGEEGESLTPTLVPLSHHSFTSTSTASPPSDGVSSLTPTPTALNESSPGTNILPEMTLEEDSPEGEGEDWSDYESEFSDVDSEGRISRESSKGNSPVDLSTSTMGEKGGVSPSGSPRRKRKAGIPTAAVAAAPAPMATLVPVPSLPHPTNGLDHLAPHPASTLPIPLDFAIGGDEGSKKRRRSWPGEFPSYEEDLGVDDFMDDDEDDEDEEEDSDSDEEEDEDADAEGEIDPDAWHDPSFHVVAQPVDLDIDIEDADEVEEDKENTSLDAKETSEGAEKKKERRMKTPVVEVGGTMSAFYVPPLPPSPPMQTATLPASPPSQHQELGPGLDVLIGGEHSHQHQHQHPHQLHQQGQDVDMGSGGGSPRQETSELDHFSPTATDGGLSPTSPSSPVSFHSPSYDPNVHPQTMENGADMFAQSSSVMSPTAYMPNMGMMYESTLPVPAPKLATIRVHALRSVEVGRVVVGKGTPVDRRRVMEWANAGSPTAAARGSDLRLEDVEGDERMGFFRQVGMNERKDSGGFSRASSSSAESGSGFGDSSAMTAPVSCSSAGGGATSMNNASMNSAGFDPMWDAFLDQLKSNGEGSHSDGGMSSPHHLPSQTQTQMSTQMQMQPPMQTHSSILTSTLRSEPERPFEPAPPPLPPSPSTPMCTPPASPLSTNPLSSPACLGFSSPDSGLYYPSSTTSLPSSTSPTSPIGSNYNGFPMGAPSMHINSSSAAAAAADFGIGMFGVGFNMGVGVGVGIGIAVGAAGVASGIVNIPPPSPNSPNSSSPPPHSTMSGGCPISPTSPAPMGGWASPPPATMGEYDQQGQFQQGAFGMSMPGDMFGDHPGSYGGFGAGGSSTLSFALG